MIIKTVTMPLVGAVCAGGPFVTACAPASHSLAQGVSFSPPSQGDLADKVGIDQKLDQRVPQDVDFKDETGKDGQNRRLLWQDARSFW